MKNLQFSLAFNKVINISTLLMLILSGCSGTIIGAGSSLGLAALEERSTREIAKDLAISSAIKFKLINAHEDFLLDMSVQVFESRALLTGILKDENLIAKAVSVAWKTEGVKDVINQIQVGKVHFRDVAADTWISAQLITKISLDRDIFAINYKVTTVNNIIYLIGIAQSRQELEKVIRHAQNIKGVNRIINYVRVNQV